MTSIRSEKTESTDTEIDNNFAAVSEVEAGIRDFVRNDIAYLRRPPTPSSTEPALEPSAEATVNSVNTLIQRVAGTSLTEIENSGFRARKPARPAARGRPARPA